MKQIVVACGSGVATSQTVASKVNRLLKENNIPAEVLAVDIKSDLASSSVSIIIY